MKCKDCEQRKVKNKKILKDLSSIIEYFGSLICLLVGIITIVAGGFMIALGVLSQVGFMLKFGIPVLASGFLVTYIYSIQSYIQLEKINEESKK